MPEINNDNSTASDLFLARTDDASPENRVTLFPITNMSNFRSATTKASSPKISLHGNSSPNLPYHQNPMQTILDKQYHSSTKLTILWQLCTNTRVKSATSSSSSYSRVIAIKLSKSCPASPKKQYDDWLCRRFLDWQTQFLRVLGFPYEQWLSLNVRKLSDVLNFGSIPCLTLFKGFHETDFVFTYAAVDLNN